MSIESRQLFNFIQGSDISGESSFDIWKSLNPNGTEAEFLEYIRSGPKGEKGDPGETAASYGLAVSASVIKKGLTGDLLPESITFKGYYRIGTEATRYDYTGRFIIEETTDGVTWTPKYTSTEDETMIFYSPSSSDVTMIRCTLYAAGDTSVELDTQTVAILTEVKPDDLEVLSAVLTNDAHVVSTDYKGEDGDFSECITAIQVFSGIRDVTSECEYNVVTCEGLEGEWDLMSYTYRVTNLSSDAGYIDIIATYNGVGVTKRFSISKAKRGKSAYETWLELEGNEGKTEEEYLADQQADWNETDETKLSYIKNRTHYETLVESEVIIVENSVELVSDPMMETIYSGSCNVTNAELIPDNIYTVVWDGTTYEDLVCFEYNGMPSLGDENILSGTGDYPFLINENSSSLVIASNVEGNHTLKISTISKVITVKQLDEKYIPDTIARVGQGSGSADWNVNDENAAGYIKNRPFYEETEEELIYSCNNVSVTIPEDQYIANYFQLTNPLIDGETYIIIFDDQEYSCIARFDSNINITYFGNQSLATNMWGMSFSETIISDEPFFFICNDQNNTLAAPSGDHTITIYRNETTTNIKTLDKKFLPNLGVDWEENDETAAGYINNRTHYEYTTEKEVILNTISASFTDPVNWGSSKEGYILNTVYLLSTLIIGQEYTVIFDNTKYVCTAFKENQYGNIIIGNGAYVSNSNEDNGIPFVIGIYNQGSTHAYVISDQGNHTFKIAIGEYSVKKLDEKFIPDTIARVDDVKNNMSGITLNQLFLIDAVNGYKYTIEMRNGTLVSSLAIDSIEVTTNPTKFFYEDGEVFDPTGMVVKVMYPDGTSTEITDYTCSEIVNSTVTITYEERGTEYTTELRVQTIESLLEDFEYTVDGNTFTLTGWKQTLNGEPSTELIVPKLPSKYKIIV